jgi:hypothetical protein
VPCPEREGVVQSPAASTYGVITPKVLLERTAAGKLLHDEQGNAKLMRQRVSPCASRYRCRRCQKQTLMSPLRRQYLLLVLFGAPSIHRKRASETHAVLALPPLPTPSSSTDVLGDPMIARHKPLARVEHMPSPTFRLPSR